MLVQGSQLFARANGNARVVGAGAVMGGKVLVADQHGAGLQAAHDVLEGVELVDGFGAGGGFALAVEFPGFAFDDVQTVFPEKEDVEFVVDGVALVPGALHLHAEGDVLDGVRLASFSHPVENMVFQPASVDEESRRLVGEDQPVAFPAQKLMLGEQPDQFVERAVGLDGFGAQLVVVGRARQPVECADDRSS